MVEAKSNKKMFTEYRKVRQSIAIDDRVKKTLKTVAVEKAKDTANKELDVYRNADIAEACKKEGLKVCWACASPNCYIKQTLCNKLGIPKQYVNGCKGKIAKFGDLSNYGLPTKTNNPKGKKPEGNENASAVIKPLEVNNYDSDNSDLEQAMGSFCSVMPKATNNVIL